MKKIVYSLVLFLAVIATGCEPDKDSEGLSHLSPEPIFELNGDPIVLVELGNSYADAGVMVNQVWQGDTTVLSGVETFTSLDTDLPGTYTITYRVKNDLGDTFYSDVSRTVVVFNDPITGIYSSDVVRNGRQMTITGTVLLVKVADETYQYSDWIGGWYDQFYGYGPRYGFSGFMGISDTDNSVSHLSSTNPWGDPGDILEGAVYDPEAETISYTYRWSVGYDFVVKLTKN